MALPLSLIHSFCSQAFGIGYRQVHPDGQVRVHSEESKPMLRVKPNLASRYQRLGFVDSVLELDPIGKLGLKASDFKVSQSFN